jgi:succinate-semialdehyde dehydrogenase/glutarate-semialdehyde dehydrogenase
MQDIFELYRQKRKMQFKSINPYNNGVLQAFDLFPETRWKKSLEISEEVYKNWRKTSYQQRADLFFRLSNLLKEKRVETAKLMSLEMGKVHKEAVAEIEKCAWVCEYYAENAEKFLHSESIDSTADKSLVRYDPIGAVLAIMPWNFPFWQVFRFAAPSLMAGNVALLKHAPNVNMCSLTIEDLFTEAGFPAGVFQSLIVDVDVVEKIINHNIVQAVTLTGSERAGASVASIAGSNIKKSVLELGGSDPFIVLADANLDNAARTGATSRMLNAGQSCIAAKRMIVVESVHDEFVEKFRNEINKIKVGDPLAEGVTMGPMARMDLAESLEKQLKASLEKGAKLELGGSRNNCIFEPTLITNVKPGMAAFDQETFGPLATVIKARDEAEAVELANKTEYGLGASLWTTDLTRAEQLSAEINSGSVFINAMVKSDPRLPFGGIKKSGYGRELSHHGIKEFVNAKTVFRVDS